MPLFMCRQCGCVDNTACAGNYWYNSAYGKLLVCSECGTGKWHERFEKRSALGMLVDQDGHLWGSDESLPKNYKIMGAVMHSGCYSPETGVECQPSPNERETMPRDATIISTEKAISLIPDGRYIHTMRGNGGLLIGADWEREDILNALKSSKEINVSDPTARAMFHGICIVVDDSWLFIETAKTNEVLDFLANQKAEVANG